MVNYKLINSKSENDYVALLTSGDELIMKLVYYIDRFGRDDIRDLTDLFRVVELAVYVKINDIKSPVNSLINDFLNILYNEFLKKPKMLMNLKVFKEPYLSKCYSPKTCNMINALLDKVNLDYKKDVIRFLGRKRVSSESLNNIYTCAPRFADVEEMDYLLNNTIYNYAKFTPQKKEFFIYSLVKQICIDLGLSYDTITINISGNDLINSDKKTNVITIGTKTLDILKNNSYLFMPLLIKEVKSLAVANTIPNNIDDFYSVKNEIFKNQLDEQFLEIYENEFGRIDDNSVIIYGLMKTNELLRNVNEPFRRDISNMILQNNKEARYLENNVNKESFFTDLIILSRIIRKDKSVMIDYPVLNILFDEKGKLRDEVTIVHYENIANDIIRLFYKVYSRYKEKDLTKFEQEILNTNKDIFLALGSASLIEKRIEQIKSEAYLKKYNIWGSKNE